MIGILFIFVRFNPFQTLQRGAFWGSSHATEKIHKLFTKHLQWFQ